MNCMIVGGKAECRQRLRSYIERKPELLCVLEAGDAKSAHALLLDNKVDVLLVDAELTGSHVLEFLRSVEQLPSTILISCNKEHAADAYELDITDFLCKPVSYERFSRAIEKVMNRQKVDRMQPNAEAFIYIKSDARIIKLNYQDILFIEAMADYMMVCTATGKYIMHSTMKALEQKLPENSFVRIHRSFIVNLNNISQVKDQSVYVNSKSIPIGTTYKEKLISRIPVI